MASMPSEFVLPRSELVARVTEAGRRTELMIRDLHDSQLAVPLLDTVNPFLWEIGHVAFFYEAFVLREMGQTEVLFEGGDEVFNSFVIDHDDRWHIDLTDRKETLAYVKEVRERVLDRLGSEEASPRETYVYSLAVAHESMHTEAFTYMRQTLGYAPPRLELPTLTSEITEAGPLRGDVSVPGGTFRVGAEREARFVFDNEKWAHPVDLEPFEIARAPVTNVEFADFVDDGGYRRKDLWTKAGWRWRKEQGAQAPVYWRRTADGWMRVAFDRLVPLEPHHPASHLNWFEAEAWCKWANRRLPSEAEWERAAASTLNGRDAGEFPWGKGAADAARANLDWRCLDPIKARISIGGCVDVAALPEGDSAVGCRQMIGNVWEWTSSDFYPFPGYIVDHPYREYSAPWFGDRKVLRGGSWATCSMLMRNTYRNFFQPQRTDVFTGFRTCAI